ncbi:MAG: hypothetical protein J3K34DRAFT_425903 [Monoraphidium minutum]|nr:MAG: hypothetical protein J3K34DRAFT_425903 [Monoraphidium minutum]
MPNAVVTRPHVRGKSALACTHACQVAAVSVKGKPWQQPAFMCWWPSPMRGGMNARYHAELNAMYSTGCICMLPRKLVTSVAQRQTGVCTSQLGNKTQLSACENARAQPPVCASACALCARPPGRRPPAQPWRPRGRPASAPTRRRTRKAAIALLTAAPRVLRAAREHAISCRAGGEAVESGSVAGGVAVGAGPRVAVCVAEVVHHIHCLEAAPRRAPRVEGPLVPGGGLAAVGAGSGAGLGAGVLACRGRWLGVAAGGLVWCCPQARRPARPPAHHWHASSRLPSHMGRGLYLPGKMSGRTWSCGTKGGSGALPFQSEVGQRCSRW